MATLNEGGRWVMPIENPKFIKIRDFTINPMYIMLWFAVQDSPKQVMLFFSGGRELTINFDTEEEKAEAVTKLTEACGMAA